MNVLKEQTFTAVIFTISLKKERLSIQREHVENGCKKVLSRSIHTPFTPPPPTTPPPETECHPGMLANSNIFTGPLFSSVISPPMTPCQNATSKSVKTKELQSSN